MNILLPIDTSQSITVYARTHTAGTYVVTVTDEQSDVATTVTATTSFSLGKLTITFAYDFTEGRFYTLNIANDGAVIHRGKIYVTSQTGKYDVISGEYTEESNVDSGWIVKS